MTETRGSRKLDPKLAETTWVHQIFGGRLRSRVTCGECDYNSDTLDRILDLSIDIFGVNSVRDALRKFVAVDHLKGANKYKCEKWVPPGRAKEPRCLNSTIDVRSRSWPRNSLRSTRLQRS